MKYIIIIILSIIYLSYGEFLINNNSENKQLVIDEFSQYYNGKNEVVLKAYDTIYGENFNYNFNDLVENNSFNDGFIYKNGKLLFSTNEKISSSNTKLNIYESDINGTNIKLIFSKDGYKSFIDVFATDDYFYIKHNNKKYSKDEGIQIDRYTISTGEYVNVDNGKYADLSFYKKNEYCKYDIKEITTIEQDIKDTGFIITDKETGNKRIINNEYIKCTKYANSFNKYKYYIRRFDISNGHILLTYQIGSMYSSSHLIFEYNFDSNEFEFKILVYPNNFEFRYTNIFYVN